MSISVPPKGDKFRRESAFSATLKVTAQANPNNTVRITEGGFWLNDIDYVEFGGGSSTTINFPATSSRWLLVTLGQTGNIALVYGIISSDPVLPELTSDKLPLAGILLNSTDSVVSEDMVFDLRPFLKVGASISGASISDIVGLQEALDSKVNVSDLSVLLADKADINGTPDSAFLLNKDATGVQSGNVVLGVARGSENDVDIRWNESTDLWEFTNDGVIWSELGGVDEALVEAIVDDAIADALLDGGEF